MTSLTDKEIRERATWAMKEILALGISDARKYHPSAKALINEAANVLETYIISEDWTRGDDPAETLLEYARDDLETESEK